MVDIIPSPFLCNIPSNSAKLRDKVTKPNVGKESGVSQSAIFAFAFATQKDIMRNFWQLTETKGEKQTISSLVAERSGEEKTGKCLRDVESRMHEGPQ